MPDAHKKHPLSLLSTQSRKAAKSNSDLMDMLDYLGIDRGYFQNKFSFETASSHIFEQQHPTCFWFHDEQQTIVSANRHFLNQYGNCIKKSCHSTLMGKDEVCGCCQSRKAFDKQAPQHCKLCHRKESGLDINTFHLPISNIHGDRFVLKSSLHINYPDAIFEDVFMKQQEERSIQELLISCAACHRIKDNEGSWVQADADVLERHSGRISHGICPECITLLYPRLFDKPDSPHKRRKS